MSEQFYVMCVCVCVCVCVFHLLKLGEVLCMLLIQKPCGETEAIIKFLHFEL